MFDHLGMPERYLPDWTYVVLAGLIMCTSLAYVVLAFIKWQQPKELSADN
jgi:Mg2+ and Co2+ transporter CorA